MSDHKQFVATIIKFTVAKLLIVASMDISNKPRLVAIHWIDSDTNNENATSAIKFAQQLGIKQSNFTFIDINSLSKSSQIQTLLLDCIEQLNGYAKGERKAFDLPMDLSVGTEFQQAVWKALQNIPYGETISYAQLAKNIGKPSAYRAVANANGKNPFSIIIPCHRVIASDGGLGGYTGGIDKKINLLQIEGRYK